MFFSLGGTKNNVWHLLVAENPPPPRGGGYGALGVTPPPSEHSQGSVEQSRSTGHSAVVGEAVVHSCIINTCDI